MKVNKKVVATAETALIDIQLRFHITCAKCGKKQQVDFSHSGSDVVKAIDLLDATQGDVGQLNETWQLGINHKPYCSQKCREEYGVAQLGA